LELCDLRRGRAAELSGSDPALYLSLVIARDRDGRVEKRQLLGDDKEPPCGRVRLQRHPVGDIDLASELFAQVCLRSHDRAMIQRNNQRLGEASNKTLEGVTSSTQRRWGPVRSRGL